MTEPGAITDWKSRILVFLAVLLAVAPRLFCLDIPLISDEGAYAYMADMLRHGGLPYVDAFDHKPPLIYYLFCASFALFGHGVTSPRILAMIFTAIACLLLLLLIHRFTKNLAAALFGSMLLGLSTISVAYIGFGPNTELFTLPFIIGGIMLLHDEDLSPGIAFASGLLFGTGFIIKQPVAVIAVCAFIVPGVRLLQKSAARFFATLCMFTLGSTLPFGAVTVYYAARGAFRPYWDSILSYNLGYMGIVTPAQSFKGLYASLVGIFLYDPVTWCAGIAGFVLLLKSSRRTWDKAYLVIILIGAGYAVSMGRSFKCYYFVLLVPILCLAAGIGLAETMTMVCRPYVRAASVMLVGISYGIVLWFLPSSGMDLKQWAEFDSYFKLPLQARSVGDYLRRIAFPDARLFIVGSESSIHFYSGLRGASRIFYFWPLVMETRMKEALQRELLTDLAVRPPDYVVVINETYSLGMGTVDGDRFIATLFDRFSRYELIGVVSDSDASLVTDDRNAMRTVVAGGASMLVLARTGVGTNRGITFEKLLGKKAADVR